MTRGLARDGGGSTLPDARRIACVTRAFRALRFPEPEGGASVAVVYPMMFSPGGDVPAPVE